MGWADRSSHTWGVAEGAQQYAQVIANVVAMHSVAGLTSSGVSLVYVIAAAAAALAAMAPWDPLECCVELAVFPTKVSAAGHLCASN